MSRMNPFEQFAYKGPPPQRPMADGSSLARNVDMGSKLGAAVAPVRRSARTNTAPGEKASAGAPENLADGSMQQRETAPVEHHDAAKRKGAGDSMLKADGRLETEKRVSEAKRAKTESNAGLSVHADAALGLNAAQIQPDIQARCKVLLEIAEELVNELQPLKFKAPVSHVYNPLEYAIKSFEQYVRRYGGRAGTVLLVGLNPGPWGMAQTGVPFGDTTMVKDFLGITTQVEQPPKVHPKRLVYGLSCPYKEVSGQRIWGWARDRYKDPELFFNKFYVMNYCPLAFMEGPNGKLRTPDKLPAAERDAVVRVCDKALAKTIKTIKPKLVIGIGQYASERVRKCAGNVRTGTIMHPSPANPATNAGWAGIAEKQLREMGLDLN